MSWRKTIRSEAPEKPSGSWKDTIRTEPTMPNTIPPSAEDITDSFIKSLAPTAIDDLRLDEPIAETVIGAGLGAAEGLTLGWRDELAARLASLGGKKPYKEQLADIEQFTKTAEAKAPIASTIGEIAGSAVLPAGMIGKAVQGASKFKSLLSAGARLAPAAATMGAIQASGKSEKPIEEQAVADIAPAAALSGAAGLAGPLAVGGATAVAKKVGAPMLDIAKQLPYISDILEGGKVGMSSEDILSESARAATKERALKTLQEPSEAASKAIQETIINPQEEALQKLSTELGQSFESGMGAKQAFLANEQVKAASKFLNRMEGLGDEAGALVGALKQQVIEASGDRKFDVLKKVVLELEEAINKSPTLRADEKAQKILQAWKDEISEIPMQVSKTLTSKSIPGEAPIVTESYKGKGLAASPKSLENVFESAEDVQRQSATLRRQGDVLTKTTTDITDFKPTLKEGATAQDVFAFQDEIGKLSSSPEMQGTPLGAQLKQAYKKSKELSSEQFFGPEGAPLREIFNEANKVYSSKLRFKDNYGIDLNRPGLAKTQILNKMQELSVNTPQAIAQRQEFLSNLRDVAPALAEDFMDTFSGLLAKSEALPVTPKPSMISQAFIESAETGSQLPLQQTRQVGKEVMPGMISQKIDEGVSIANTLKQASEDLKSLDLRNALNAARGSTNLEDLRASLDIKKFVEAIGKVDKEKAANLMANHGELLDALSLAQKLQDSNFGPIRKGLTLAGLGGGRAIKGVASAVTDVVQGLKNMSPDSVNMLTERALAANKKVLAGLLKQVTSEDKVARNAALYMLSQNSDHKKDIEDIRAQIEQLEVTGVTPQE